MLSWVEKRGKKEGEGANIVKLKTYLCFITTDRFKCMNNKSSPAKDVRFKCLSASISGSQTVLLMKAT